MRRNGMEAVVAAVWCGLVCGCQMGGGPGSAGTVGRSAVADERSSRRAPEYAGREIGGNPDAGAFAETSAERERTGTDIGVAEPTDSEMVAMREFLKRTEQYQLESRTAPALEARPVPDEAGIISRRTAGDRRHGADAAGGAVNTRSESVGAESSRGAGSSPSASGTAGMSGQPGHAGVIETGPEPVAWEQPGGKGVLVANDSVAADAPALPSPHGAAAGAPVTPVLRSVRIRIAAPEAEPAAAEATAGATNAPLDVEAAGQTDSFAAFLTRLEAESSGDFEGQWSLKLAQLALHQQEAAQRTGSGLPEPQAHLLTALVDTAVATRGAVREPGRGVEEALRRVEVLRARLGAMADLTIANVALCRRVQTFGAYDVMATEEFVAGRTIQTIVYCEIRHFSTEPTEDGRVRTVLSTRLELMTADGQSVWQQEQPEISDLCRVARNDFFLAQRITWPPTLAAGEYVLKVRVEDRLSGRAHEVPVQVTILAPTPVRSRS